MTGLDVGLAIASLASIAGAALAVTRRNAIYAAFFLVCFFLGIACVLALLSAPFVAIMQVLVYAGAIMVLFLFIIMMLNLRRNEPELGGGRRDQPYRLRALVPALLVFAAAALPARFVPVAWPAVQMGFGSTAEVGRAIYGPYVLAFEVVSVLILAAIVGAVAVAGDVSRRSPAAGPPADGEEEA